jgi:hypothetical protein
MEQRSIVRGRRMIARKQRITARQTSDHRSGTRAHRVRRRGIVGERRPPQPMTSFARVRMTFRPRDRSPGRASGTEKGTDLFLRLASTLAELCEVQKTDAQALYTAMDWLGERQAEIEKKLAKRHLEDGALVLYDVSSTYFEGKFRRHRP